MGTIDKNQLCANILSIENEIEMIKEQEMPGLKKKQIELKKLKSKLRRINSIEGINNEEHSPHTW